MELVWVPYGMGLGRVALGSGSIGDGLESVWYRLGPAWDLIGIGLVSVWVRYRIF